MMAKMNHLTGNQNGSILEGQQHSKGPHLTFLKSAILGNDVENPGGMRNS